MLRVKSLSFPKKYLIVMIAVIAIGAFSIYSCKTKGRDDAMIKKDIIGESFVLSDTIAQNFLYTPNKGSVVVKSTYMDLDSSITYTEGKDYTIDYLNSSIHRTENSRIPDYALNPMYGKEIIDDATLGKYEQWTNNKYFIYVDYNTNDSINFVVSKDIKDKIPKSINKLKSGEALKIIWYGNSVTSGGEASVEQLSFTHRVEDYLKKSFQKSTINSENLSISGYGTPEAVAWFNDRFIDKKPDLVFVGFGLNDQCDIGTASCSPEQFEKNLIILAKNIKDSLNAELVFYSEFPPNRRWIHNTQKMNEFAAASKNAAEKTNSGYIAVYESWMNVLQKKNEESLLANNINHPNDFGHWIFYKAFVGAITKD